MQKFIIQNSGGFTAIIKAKTKNSEIAAASRIAFLCRLPLSFVDGRRSSTVGASAV
nr:hypothetical protein Iba_chr08cCG8390 [Ipomoea batatas]